MSVVVAVMVLAVAVVVGVVVGVVVAQWRWTATGQCFGQRGAYIATKME